MIRPGPHNPAPFSDSGPAPCRGRGCHRSALPGFRGFCGACAAREAERHGGARTVEMFPEMERPKQLDLLREGAHKCQSS